MSENNPEVEKAAPVDVKSSVPLQVEIIASSVEALGGTVPTTIPEKDPLLLDLDIARAQPKPQETPVPVAAPLPVLIAAEQSPVPVVVQATSNAPLVMPPTVMKNEGVTLPPTTTEADDKVTEGQRHINRVWEYSQSAIALLITMAVVYCAINEITSAELSNGFFLIIGFYFSRANHQNQGGVGPKPQEGVYTGR